MTSNKNISNILSVIAIMLLLQACGGGGSSTTKNSNTGTDRTNYNGPPAATDHIRAYQLNVWQNLNAENRCGQCHGNGQQPTFVDLDDVNIAYAQALPIVNQRDPENSLLVTKVGGGHNCWLDSDQACADSIERMIINWTGSTSTSTVRQIKLTAPVIKDPGTSKTFPVLPTDSTPSFLDTIYPLLVGNCQGCHTENSSMAQSPFFASNDPISAYAAARPKFDVDNPGISRLVVRLRQESHNCWTDSCLDDAQDMEDAIIAFANGIVPVTVDPDLVISKAMTIVDGIVSSGGSRHESNLVSIWEFKAGPGSTTAFDTAGIEPAVNLTLSGDVDWLGSFGLDFKGGKAQGDTTASRRIHDAISSSGEYSLETWVIPANVTQEEANIVSYSFGAIRRNFTLGQNLYNYNLYNRTNESDANGEAFLSTEDAGEILQSNLQHVVATYDPINGRSIYVNGKLIGVADAVTISSISDWNDGYALVMGNEISNDRMWEGKLRMAAIHSRILTPEQIQRNFEVGVGLKYFLLFYVGDVAGVPADSYILFEVAQFDEYGYLFNKPTFVNLDPDWVPVSIAIEGIRIGLNGKEAVVGQSFANLNATINATDYVPGAGQLLSQSGGVIPLEKGTGSDEFFLAFGVLGDESHTYIDPNGVVPTPGPDADPVSDIGVRTFDEINASIAAITGVSVTNTEVSAAYQLFRQQLPAVETFSAYLSSHQMAVAQLTLASCSELVENNPGYFSGFVWASAGSAFNNDIKRGQIVEPLLQATANIDVPTQTDNLNTQPDEDTVRGMIGGLGSQDLVNARDNNIAGSYSSLITTMVASGPNSVPRTRQIVKATCAAVVGSAVMLIQ